MDGASGYQAVVEAHYGRVRRLAQLLLADPEEARDVAQDVFLKLHRAYDRDDPPVAWGPWLTRVTVNACRDRRRVGWWPRWRHATDRVERLDLPALEPNPEEVAVRAELRRRVWHAFRALSRRQREVFVLRHLEGWSTEEVATTLGLGVGSVKQHLFRAVHRLRAAAAESP